MSVSELKPLIFYDIDNKERKCWSPNTWRARLGLNYKGVPYKTEWISYPDIAGLLSQPPHNVVKQGPVYTLPALVDPNHPEVGTLSDSIDIVLHLDKYYPDLPMIYPHGTYAFRRPWQVFTTQCFPEYWKYLIPKVPAILDDRGEEYFLRTRKIDRGVEDLYELYPTDGGVSALKSLQCLEPVLESIPEGPFMLGKEPCLYDFSMVAVMAWMRAGNPEVWEWIWEHDEKGLLKGLWEACGPWLGKDD